VRLGHIPTRLATGAFIFHSGWEKWHGDEDTAAAIHGFAVGTYPMLDVGDRSRTPRRRVGRPPILRLAKSASFDSEGRALRELSVTASGSR
jgi:hypothetical protein